MVHLTQISLSLLYFSTAQYELRSWELLREAARGVYPYYPAAAAAAASSAYYYHPNSNGVGGSGGASGGSAISHPSSSPPDLYNSINSATNHRINIAV